MILRTFDSYLQIAGDYLRHPCTGIQTLTATRENLDWPSPFDRVRRSNKLRPLPKRYSITRIQQNLQILIETSLPKQRHGSSMSPIEDLMTRHAVQIRDAKAIQAFSNEGFLYLGAANVRFLASL